MIDRKYWDKGVTLETDELGKIQTVSSTDEAARFLLEHWPDEGGTAYDAARRACLAALAGETPVDVARQAFVDAAREAGTFIRG